MEPEPAAKAPLSKRALLALGALFALVVVAMLVWLYWNKLDEHLPGTELPVAELEAEGFLGGAVLVQTPYSDDYKTQTLKVYAIPRSVDERPRLVYTDGPYAYVEPYADESRPFMLQLRVREDERTVIYEVDLRTKGKRELVRETGDRFLGYAGYLMDGTTYAYITSMDDMGRSVDSRLTLLDTVAGSERTYELRKGAGALYAGFGIMAEDPERKLLYLSEAGGDAGYVWAKWHTLDLASGTITEIPDLPITEETENGGGPVRSYFTDDRKSIVYKKFSHQFAPEDLRPYTEALPGCLIDSGPYESEGGVVIVRDLATGAEREVYRNLRYPDNSCLNRYRVIAGIFPIDADHAAVITLEGVEKVNIRTKAREMLYAYPARRDMDEIYDNLPVHFSHPYLFFSDGSLVNVETDTRLHPSMNGMNGRVVAW